MRDELKSRAAIEGTSLNAYLKALLEQAADSPRRSDVFERIRARSERSGTPSAEVIRGERDARGASQQR